MPNKLILYMYESWAQVDSTTEGLTAIEATTRHDVGSGIAWTVGHVTHMLDTWINTRFQRLPPHPFISRQNFRTGGTGEENDWPAVQGGLNEVRGTARKFLDSEDGLDLDRVIPYDGSIPFVRSVGLSLGYALMRIAAHHFMHAGEILTIRSHLGHVLSEGPDWGRRLV